MPQVLGGSKLHIDALGLEDYSDLAAQSGGVFRYVKSFYYGAAAIRHHQCRKNTKHCGLAAAVGSEQSKQLCMTHVERDSVQRGAASIAMHQILN